MGLVKVEPYQGLHDEEIISHVLSIQAGEFHIPITRADQPDLCAIKEFYQKGAGNFWLALWDGKVIGTLGLLDIGRQQGALRKMFVQKDFRGAKYRAAQSLLEETLNWAKEKNFRQLFLGTTPAYLAAHQFYRKNGFLEIQMTDLPENFPVMKVDTIFFRFDF